MDLGVGDRERRSWNSLAVVGSNGKRKKPGIFQLRFPLCERWWVWRVKERTFYNFQRKRTITIRFRTVKWRKRRRSELCSVFDVRFIGVVICMTSSRLSLFLMFWISRMFPFSDLSPVVFCCRVMCYQINMTHLKKNRKGPIMRMFRQQGNGKIV